MNTTNGIQDLTPDKTISRIIYLSNMLGWDGKDLNNWMATMAIVELTQIPDAALVQFEKRTNVHPGVIPSYPPIAVQSDMETDSPYSDCLLVLQDALSKKLGDISVHD